MTMVERTVEGPGANPVTDFNSTEAARLIRDARKADDHGLGLLDGLAGQLEAACAEAERARLERDADVGNYRAVNDSLRQQLETSDRHLLDVRRILDAADVETTVQAAERTVKESDSLRQQLETERAEVERLTTLINTPLTDEFFEAVRIEAAHQIERWGAEHDAGKRAEDWITLLIYLLGKAARAHFDSDQPKLEHHVITGAAVALNWWRRLVGVSFAMRPGVADRSAP